MFQSLGKSDRVWLKDRKGHQISLETCFRRILCNKEYLLFVFCTHIHFASSIYFNCRISSITVAIHFSGSMLNSGGVPPETYEKNVFGMSGSHSLQQFLRQETVEAQAVLPRSSRGKIESTMIHAQRTSFGLDSEHCQQTRTA